MKALELDEEVTFREASIALARKRDPYGRKLKRMVLARELQTSKVIAVRVAVGPARTALRITMGALYRAFPELQPSDADKLARMVRPLVEHSEARMRDAARKVIAEEIDPVVSILDRRICFLEESQKLTEQYLAGMTLLRRSHKTG